MPRVVGDEAQTPGGRPRAGPTSAGSPPSPLCTHTMGGPISSTSARKASPSCIVEPPRVAHVGVGLPRGQVVPLGLGPHRVEGRPDRAHVRLGVALHEHPAVAAQLVGGPAGGVHHRRRTGGRGLPARGWPRARPSSCRTARRRGRASGRCRSRRGRRRSPPAGTSCRRCPGTRSSSRRCCCTSMIGWPSPPSTEVATSGSVVDSGGEVEGAGGRARRHPSRPRAPAGWRPTPSRCGGSRGATSPAAGRRHRRSGGPAAALGGRTGTVVGGANSPFEHGPSLMGRPGSSGRAPTGAPAATTPPHRVRPSGLAPTLTPRWLDPASTCRAAAACRACPVGWRGSSSSKSTERGTLKPASCRRANSSRSASSSAEGS